MELRQGIGDVQITVRALRPSSRYAGQKLMAAHRFAEEDYYSSPVRGQENEKIA
jgi:hypothetical protein